MTPLSLSLSSFSLTSLFSVSFFPRGTSSLGLGRTKDSLGKELSRVDSLFFLPQGPPGPRGRPGPPVGSCMLGILDSWGRRQVPLNETKVISVCF